MLRSVASCGTLSMRRVMARSFASKQGGSAVVTRKTAFRKQKVDKTHKERSLRGIESTQNLLEDVINDALEDGEIDESQAKSLRSVTSYENASARELTHQRIKNLILKYGKDEADCGRTEVQVAIISERLEVLKEHMAKNHKDRHSRRGMEALFHRRRYLMAYLKRTRFDVYERMLADMDLDMEEMETFGRMENRGNHLPYHY